MINELITTAASIDWTGLTAAAGLIFGTISSLVAVIFKRETKQTQAFFDPTNEKVMTPPKGTPDRSWKMSDGVKQFILAGHTESEKTSILQQIDEAEKAGLVDYKVVHDNGYYNISYGQIAGGAAGGK